MEFIFDKEDWRVILKNLGLVLIIIGASFIMPLLISIVLSEYSFTGIFLLIVIISAISGFFLRVVRTNRQFLLRHALVLSGIVWLIIPLLSTLPFVFYGFSPVDSYFETMSGWTTTGMTTIANVEVLPKSLLFFRSFMHWVGGIGIIILVLTILRTPQLGFKLYRAETRTENIKANVFDTVKLIWTVYLFFTIFGVIFLSLFGMPIFDSINHTMSALSTGGFSVKNDSIGFYSSMPINLIIIFLMFVGGTNFVILYYVLKGKFNYLKNSETIWMVLLVIIFSFLIALALNPKSISGIISIIFTTVSALSCTGYTVINISPFTDFIKFAIIILMVIGASSGSTTGAIKIWRFIIILKSAYKEILRYIIPEHIFMPIKFNGRIIPESEIRRVDIFILIYIFSLIVSSLMFMGIGYSFMDSIFTVTSAQGNVGLSIIPAEKLFYIPAVGKIILIICMWLGRLEILPALTLLRSILPK